MVAPSHSEVQHGQDGRNTFVMLVNILKMVAGLLLGVVGASLLVVLAGWHLLREMDRMDSRNGE
jgi:hypothetical protein